MMLMEGAAWRCRNGRERRQEANDPGRGRRARAGFASSLLCLLELGEDVLHDWENDLQGCQRRGLREDIEHQIMFINVQT